MNKQLESTLSNVLNSLNTNGELAFKECVKWERLDCIMGVFFGCILICTAMFVVQKISHENIYLKHWIRWSVILMGAICVFSNISGILYPEAGAVHKLLGCF